MSTRPEYRIPKMEWASVEEENRGWLDSTEFAEFCTAVRSAMTGPTTIGDLRRAMGDGFDERRILDALSSLEGIGAVRQSRYISPLTWEPQAVPVKAKRKFNGDLGSLGADKTLPSPESYQFGKNRVTA